MSNTKLLTISIIIIIILAGIPHLLHAFSDKETEMIFDSQTEEVVSDNKVETTTDDNPFLGKWKVDYNSDDFKGSIIYQIKNDKGTLKGFSIRLIDEYGQSMNDNTLALTLEPQTHTEAKGTYIIEYEGETYDVPCTIEIVSKKQFKLHYDYYSYSDTEIWNKTN